jgi:hypothetical protein
METITKNRVKEEIKILEQIVNSKKIMTPKIKNELKNKGYIEANIGTGKSAYTYSRRVEVIDVQSKFFLNGRYLVVGCANQQYGKGCLYIGFVKEIA